MEVEKGYHFLATRILLIYEHSTCYVGTKLWNDLPVSVQELPDIFAFKKEIAPVNCVYVKL